MGVFMDLTGRRFGRLVCIARAPNHKKQTVWSCRCDCGKITEVQLGHLRGGKIISCGCYQRENNKQKATKHGDRWRKLYYIWAGIRQRCENKRNKGYKYYGQKGISVAPEWHNYAVFKEWALSNGYAEGLTIERKNVFGNYEPSNCCWIPRSEQAKNTTRTLNNRQMVKGGHG